MPQHHHKFSASNSQSKLSPAMSKTINSYIKKKKKLFEFTAFHNIKHPRVHAKKKITSSKFFFPTKKSRKEKQKIYVCEGIA